MRPVDLRLLAGQGAQAQVGLGRRTRAHAGHEVAEVRAAAHVAALADHRVQPRGGERRELGQRLEEERPIRIDPARAQRRAVHRRAVAAEHAPHGVAVHVQLPRDGAHAPLLDRVEAQDLRDQVRGQRHDAVRRAPPRAGRGAGTPGAATLAGEHRSDGRSRRRWMAPGAAASPPGRCRPVRMRRCRASMRPVEQPPPGAGNPGASRYVRRRRRRRRRHDAGASGAIVPNGPCGRGASADSGGPPLAEPRHAPGASRAGRSSGCRDRSGCTARPARGNGRTGTGGPDGPCAHPGRTEGAGRTRPGAPDLPGTAFIGTV